MTPNQTYRNVAWGCSALAAFVILVTGAPATQAEVNEAAQQVFRADVSRVQIDVIVRDDRGFVDDLRLEDFRVYEDDAQVAIASLELVELGDVGPPASAGHTDLTESHLLSPSPPSEPAQGRGAVIFLVDGPSLSATTKQRFAEAWTQIVGGSELDSVSRAAYFIDYANRVVELAPLSRDRDLLMRAADRVSALPITTESRKANLIDLVSALPSPDPEFAAFFGASSSDSAARAAIAKVRSLEGTERMQSLASYDVLTAFCDALAAIDGRKAVVWVSSGVKLMSGGAYAAVMAAYQDAAERGQMTGPGLEAVAGIREIIRSLNDPDDIVLERQRRLHETANSANVSIYAVDPTPLVEARTPGFDAGLGPGAFREALSSPSVVRALDALGDSLRNAATATGGRAFVHWTDIGAALQEIEVDASRYYLLTYEPPRAEPDGAYHDVRVEVDRPGIRVRFRSGYRHLTAAERNERTSGVVRQLPGLAQRRQADTPHGAPSGQGAAAPMLPTATPMVLPANAVRLVGSWVRWDASRAHIAWGAHLVNTTNVGIPITLTVRFVDRDGAVLGEDSDAILLRPGSIRFEKTLSNIDGALNPVHSCHVLVDATTQRSRK